MSLKLILTTLCIMLFAVSVSAEVPNTVNYQGRLADATGDPVADGAYLVKFIIYDAPTAGTDLWNTGFQTINTVDGLFTYQLGSNVTLPNAIFIDSSRYLGLTVGTDAELLPRTRFLAVPYAYRSKVSDQASIADDAQTLAGEDPDFYLNWADMTNVPAGFADGIDNGTTYTAGSGLQLVGSVFSVNLPTGFITSTDVLDNSLTSNDLASNSVGSSEIATGAVGTLEIAINGVGTSEIATNAVGSDEIATGAVGSSEILDNSITSADLATASVFSSEIATNAVGASEIIAGAVGTSEVADNSLTSADLAANSVGSSEIANSAVGTSEILNNSVVDWDIIDEPGLSQGITTNYTIIYNSGSNMVDIITTTIDIPTSGYIFLIAKCYVTHYGTLSSNRILIQIDEEAGGNSEAPHNVSVGNGAYSSTLSHHIPTTVTRTYYKSSAGTYTFRLEAIKTVSTGNSQVNYPVITAIFIPTSYGTVSTVVADPNGDPDAKMVSITDELGNTHTGYEVDLRNLELRVQDAEIKALEARQALNDAQNANK